jgi:protein-L-isoaspartate(D-aspartate) O-methyltransferase
MDRRRLLLGMGAFAALSGRALARDPFSPDLWPPMTGAAFVPWMVAHRGEDPTQLARRFERYQEMLSFYDLWTSREKRAFLLTPREEFVLPQDRDKAYAAHYLDIGFGVSITPPGTMGRMTSVIAVQPSDRVLEIGTGSGYQSALLSYLTNQIYTIEIIPELAARTRGIYNRLIGAGYHEYAAISTQTADGYYGWATAAPFDKIIVTCGIDHIPPPLLQQLTPNGIMVIPIGPPGAQHVLKAVKQQSPDGRMSVVRSDIYGGAIIPFVPFTGSHPS